MTRAGRGKEMGPDQAHTPLLRSATSAWYGTAVFPTSEYHGYRYVHNGIVREFFNKVWSVTKRFVACSDEATRI